MPTLYSLLVAAVVGLGIVAAVWRYMPRARPGTGRIALRIVFVGAAFGVSCILAFFVFGLTADLLGMGERGLSLVVLAGVPSAILCTVIACVMLARRAGAARKPSS